MATATYTKTGNKASVNAKLSKDVFGLEVTNHELLKQAYVAYLANGRVNLAVAKKRGEVRGGGRKPWAQKGTGRARFGSTRNPIWRGGGAAFGPTGNENYTHRQNLKAKRLAVKQALSLANAAGKVKIIESIEIKDGKTASALKLVNKISSGGNTLIVSDNYDQQTLQAFRNLPNVITARAHFLNVYNILNADDIIVSQKALAQISDWLASKTSSNKSETGK